MIISVLGVTIGVMIGTITGILMHKALLNLWIPPGFEGWDLLHLVPFDTLWIYFMISFVLILVSAGWALIREKDLFSLERIRQIY